MRGLEVSSSFRLVYMTKALAIMIYSSNNISYQCLSKVWYFYIFVKASFIVFNKHVGCYRGLCDRANNVCFIMSSSR